MKSFMKKAVVVFVICVVLNHFTDINLSGALASKIDEMSNSTYASEFVENCQKKADYLIDNFKFKVLKKDKDQVAFEVTLGLPENKSENPEFSEDYTVEEETEIIPDNTESLSENAEKEEDDTSGNIETKEVNEQLDQLIQLVKTAGKAVLEEIDK